MWFRTWRRSNAVHRRGSVASVTGSGAFELGPPDGGSLLAGFSFEVGLKPGLLDRPTARLRSQFAERRHRADDPGHHAEVLLHVGRDEESPALAKHAGRVRGEPGREHAPLLVPRLPPRVGKVDVDRRDAARPGRSRRKDPPRVGARPSSRSAACGRRTASWRRAGTCGRSRCRRSWCPAGPVAAVSRNSPLPIPTSISTGLALPKSCCQSIEVQERAESEAGCGVCRLGLLTPGPAPGPAASATDTGRVPPATGGGAYAPRRSSSLPSGTPMTTVSNAFSPPTYPTTRNRVIRRWTFSPCRPAPAARRAAPGGGTGPHRSRPARSARRARRPSGVRVVAAQLRRRLAHQHAGQQREAGHVAADPELVRGHVLVPDDEVLRRVEVDDRR